jgi:Alginate lyase
VRKIHSAPYAHLQPLRLAADPSAAGQERRRASVNPAAASPPWLSTDDSGGLAFFAPVDGAKTKNSDHARTELVGLGTFTAGSGRHTLRASITVSQVPADARDVIIGQIHGADTIKSVPFVMLHYDAFRGATVRFQAGAYQQGRSGHGAAADDGARLTFFARGRSAPEMHTSGVRSLMNPAHVALGRLSRCHTAGRARPLFVTTAATARSPRRPMRGR